MASAYSKETFGRGQALGPRRPGNSMTAERARRLTVLRGADGVQVGQDDLPADSARAIVGPDLLLGVSASTVDEAVDVDRSGADYLGYGAMFPTATKSDAEYAGPAMLATVKHRVRLPVV